jgi:hypothetical protein
MTVHGANLPISGRIGNFDFELGEGTSPLIVLEAIDAREK